MCKTERDKSQKSCSYNWSQKWFFQELFHLINYCVTIIKKNAPSKGTLQMLYDIMLDILLTIPLQLGALQFWVEPQVSMLCIYSISQRLGHTCLLL